MALKELNLNLKKNEILGIIGPNGSGKSTIFNVVGAVVPLDKGKLILGGTELVNVSEKGDILGALDFETYDLFLETIGFCLQDDVFWGDLTIENHFTLISKIIGLKSSETIVKTWIEILGLTNFSKFKA
jgi:ABC-type multidrug transport system ATPase subunit